MTTQPSRFSSRTKALGAAAASFLVGCSSHQVSTDRVAHAIDAYHDAASHASLEDYIGRMAPTGVFLGTDATERWTRDEFRAFCEPYFSEGRGWTYVPTQRHIQISRGGKTAWFDETLTNESYGTLRGTGVLTRKNGDWFIEQYSLTFLVPNVIAKEVVSSIREFERSDNNAEEPDGD